MRKIVEAAHILVLLPSGHLAVTPAVVDRWEHDVSRARKHSSPRKLAVAIAVLLAVSACGGNGGDDAGGAAGGADPKRGGTLTLLTVQEELDHLDPQRNYSGEDL